MDIGGTRMADKSASHLSWLVNLPIRCLQIKFLLNFKVKLTHLKYTRVSPFCQ